MNEQAPQPQTPGFIEQVPAEFMQGVAEPVPAVAPTEQLYGGYTGINVGQMAKDIARLQAAGRNEEAAALTAKLNEVSPGIPVPTETEQ